MNDRKRDPWRAPYVTGEYAISGMWYLVLALIWAGLQVGGPR